MQDPRPMTITASRICCVQLSCHIRKTILHHTGSLSTNIIDGTLKNPYNRNWMTVAGTTAAKESDWRGKQ